MQRPIRASYLETDVMTATPEKLQTMLIDGAIKNLQRGRLLWNDNRDEEACESLIRAQQIIAQILAGFRREVDAELARKVAAIYLFLFRTIGERKTPATKASSSSASASWTWSAKPGGWFARSSKRNVPQTRPGRRLRDCRAIRRKRRQGPPVRRRPGRR